MGLRGGAPRGPRAAPKRSQDLTKNKYLFFDIKVDPKMGLVGVAFGPLRFRVGSRSLHGSSASTRLRSASDRLQFASAPIRFHSALRWFRFGSASVRFGSPSVRSSASVSVRFDSAPLRLYFSSRPIGFASRWLRVGPVGARVGSRPRLFGCASVPLAFASVACSLCVGSALVPLAFVSVPSCAALAQLRSRWCSLRFHVASLWFRFGPVCIRFASRSLRTGSASAPLAFVSVRCRCALAPLRPRWRSCRLPFASRWFRFGPDGVRFGSISRRFGILALASVPVDVALIPLRPRWRSLRLLVAS